MPKSGYYAQRCPHDIKGSFDGPRPRLAVCMQVVTIGERPRRRARAVTIYPCDKCIEKIVTKAGRPLRKALAAALVRQAKQLRNGKAV